MIDCIIAVAEGPLMWGSLMWHSLKRLLDVAAAINWLIIKILVGLKINNSFGGGEDCCIGAEQPDSYWPAGHGGSMYGPKVC